MTHAVGSSNFRMAQQQYAIIRVYFLTLDAYCTVKDNCTGCSFYSFDMLISLVAAIFMNFPWVAPLDPR